MFKKVLIANRGEIALRVIRACRDMGLRSVAVHSTADTDALHVRFADEKVCIGPPPGRLSYLSIPALISAAEVTGADAVHPGYGFLSENADFAETVIKCGLHWIGPQPEVMRIMGDKVAARAAMSEAGVPILPGTGVLETDAEALEAIERIGLPVIIKAVGGGGGRGMKIVEEKSKLFSQLAAARSEAQAGFNNPQVYIERYIGRPRHVEVQVLGDGSTAIALGERECSIQRRHQKLVEEAPSVALDDKRRNELLRIARKATQSLGYKTVGTLEFLLDEDKRFYFMEMNTRIQVEHTVTEEVFGVDLVREQIRLAAGDPLRLRPDLRPRGHAIELRINAEDPVTFAPSPGKITEYHPPGGAGVRVDSGVYGGWRVPPNYDSLLAKVIVHAPTRTQAIARMGRALDEF
ncbi:MAG TPA: acetyl-CoA carboxylase biotin carboxylase subunit, partial [Polyangia bacterium]|nr:acetyl-CoA carboxylase biotin carboxylase subunit [Polyangia bacterium]